MDALMSELIYDEVMAQTKEARDKLLVSWMDCGKDLTSSEEKEISTELERIGLMGERSAAITRMVLLEAKDRIMFAQSKDWCEEKGLKMVEADQDDDEEEDEEME